MASMLSILSTLPQMSKAILILSAAVASIGTGCTYGPPTRAHTMRFGVVLCDCDTAEARAVVGSAEQAVLDVAEALGIPPPTHPVLVRVFPSRRSLQNHLARTAPHLQLARGVLFKGVGEFEAVIYLTGRPEGSLALLRHEMAHYVMASHFGHVPPWTDEGLAFYFESGPPYCGVHKPMLELLAITLRHEDDLLAGLVASPSLEHLGPFEYAQSWALAHFLAHRQGGMESIAEYLRLARPGPQAVQAFKEAFGQSPEEMEAEWRGHVAKMVRQAGFRP